MFGGIVMFCSKCGAENTNDNKFCSNCGQVINHQREQSTSQSLVFTFNGITVDLQEIINRNGKNKINAIKELRELTKIDLATGKKVIDEAYLGRIYYPTEKEIKVKNNKGCLTVLLWVFFLPIMGIITIVKNEKLTKRVKVILISIIVFISLLAGIDGIIDNQQAEKKAYDNLKISVENKEYIKAQEEINSFLNEYSSSKYVEEVKKIQTTVNSEAEKIRVKEAEAKAKQKNIDVLMKATTLNQAEAEQVFSDLKSVGLLSITKCNTAIGTGVDNLQSFSAEADSHTILLTIKNRKTYYIGYGGTTLFDVSKGGVLNQIKDLTLTSEEITHFISAAQYYVKQCLKSPSSAKFPGQVWSLDQWSVGRYKNVVEISSYVDSQNSFGADIRNKFTVQMNYNTSKCTYLSINGKKLSGTYFTRPR